MDPEHPRRVGTNLLGILEQERLALRNADIHKVLALAEMKFEALRNLSPHDGTARLQRLAAENRDFLAHLLECVRSTLITAVTPDGMLYSSEGGAPGSGSDAHR